MSAKGSRLLGDTDELTRFQPRGLSGGAEQPAVPWRATRLEAENKTAGVYAVVAEVRDEGWRWEVTKGPLAVGNGRGLSKEQAVAMARRAWDIAMSRRGGVA